jgi:hypothetical protein
MALDRRTELANSVVAGRDGWLFHRDDFAFERMSGAMSLSREDLRAWVATHSRVDGHGCDRACIPLSRLIAERVNRDTYHSVESDWNFFGGFIAYRALAHEIVKRTNASIVDFGELVTLPGRVHAGDLGVRLEPEQVSPEHICRVQVRQKQNDFREWALRSRPLGVL